jgi:predicted phosphohydrolase
MAIFVTGDTHGFYNAQMKARFMPESINVLAEKLGRDITRGDYMIIAGDVGLIWFNEANDMENAMLDWVESLPWTTLFIDGNHENLTRMRALPETDMFGGKVSVLSEHVIYLRQRGQVYEIDGQKIWCFGGGTSVDKDVNSPKQGLPRVKGISWVG